jgi:prephenate dehydratase
MLVVPGVVKEDLKQIATHPQSFSQCERHLRREYNGLLHLNWDDTAKAAKDLAQGVLSKDTGVIAPTRSAKIYNLEILEKGIQDNYPNLTTFIIVKK